MNLIDKVLIAIPLTALLVGYLLYLWNNQKKRKIHIDFFMTRYNSIKEAQEEFLKFGRFRNGYFSNYQEKEWLNKYLKYFDEIKDREYVNIGLEVEVVKTIHTFLYYYKDSAGIRKDFNKQFIPIELKAYKTFFEKIENHGLDEQQQVAVVTDEDNSIVIAGAGSGKTTTIVGKVNYVIDRYDIPPNEILLISFTKKSALDLGKRINIEGVDVKTFHKFGRDVISEVDGIKPSIFDEKQFDSVLRNSFEQLIKEREYLEKVILYFTDFRDPVDPQKEFEDKGTHFQHLKDQNIKPFKIEEIVIKGKKTLRREVVKSIEECKIANFLLFNGINYKYEYPYEHLVATENHAQYKPDFTLFTKKGKIYLEHFGINKEMKVPPFFADAEKGETNEEATKKYVDGIKWKRDLHKSYKTILIETYSYEMFDGTLYDNLTKRLSDAGVEVCPKSPEECWEIIKKSASDEIDQLIKLFGTFITLMKSNNYQISNLLENNKLMKSVFQQKRNVLFVEIIIPLFEKYENHLIKIKEIDFSDMINKASSYITSRQFGKKYSYVIVDEFQDISIGRYQLLRAIKNVNPSCKLFCVGDDWQSIYRFTGSDIALFKNFESYFGYTVKSKIETTYRFHKPLLALSSEFILKNPNQTVKELKNIGVSKTTQYEIVYSPSGNQDDSTSLKSIFEKVSSLGITDKKDILVLGRYSRDIERIKNEDGLFKIDKDTKKIAYKGIEATYMTVHKSKGLEADIIVILNCNAGKLGFPSEMSDDPVLNLLLSEADQFENGEERRLFYVAMTRAKEKVYFVADEVYKSKFIAELEDENEESKIRKCPRCVSSDLVKRTGVKKDGKPWAFWGCSNFMYGCEYQQWIKVA